MFKIVSKLISTYKYFQWSAATHSLPFKCPLHKLILLDHLQILHNTLNFNSSKSYTIWAVVLTAFWGYQHLGELLPISKSKFDPSCNVTFDCNFWITWVHNCQVIIFYILWSKTTWDTGVNCSLVEHNDIFCPIWALTNHLSFNFLSNGFPLFSFQDGSLPFDLLFLTKSNFLSFTNHDYPLFSQTNDFLIFIFRVICLKNCGYCPRT